MDIICDDKIMEIAENSYCPPGCDDNCGCQGKCNGCKDSCEG